MPSWLVAALVAAILVGIGALVFLYMPSRERQTAEAAPQTALEKPGTPGVIAAHPLAKHLEVTGFRITEDARKKAKVQFLVVNHSGAEIADLGMNISLRPKTAKPEDAPLCSFTFKIPSLAPYEAKDISENVQMQLRPYELPDWQFLSADARITSPPAQ